MSDTRWPRAILGNMRRALLLVILIAVLPLLAVQVVIFWTWFASLRQDELYNNLEVARGVAVAFEAFVRDVVSQETLLAAAFLESKEPARQVAEHLLETNARDYPAIDAWHWTDPAGKVLASTDRRLVGTALKGPQSWLEKIPAGRSWIVGDLEDTVETHAAVFLIVYRIEDSQERFQGLIVAEVDAEKLGRTALRMTRPEEGILTVFDRQGAMAYRYPNIGIGRWEWYPADEILDTALSTQREAMGTMASPVDGRQRFVARVPMPEIGWVAGAGRPVEVAMAPAIRTVWRMVAANLVIVVLSLAGAGGLSQAILRSLRQLGEHAAAIGQGELAQRIETRGIREFGELAETLNRTATRLQERSLAVDKALEELRRSNKELEQFAYVASHDLQEPLRVITGYLQLIERRYRGQLDADGEQFIDYVVEAVNRMQQLITDLLQYSRVGSRGRALVPADSESAFCEALSGLQKRIDETGARVTHDPLPVVRGDVQQLVQLFQNLIANSLKFRHESRPPEVHVSARPEGEHWVFSVRDNGIGIEPQYFEQIFVIFQRLHTRQRYPGTGIGLAICKKIVERHGGRIWLESQPGSGSTFHFTL